MKTGTDCANGEHLVIRDRFAGLPGVTRAVPGDVYCKNCKQPLPYWFNGGKPIRVSQPKEPA